MRVSALQKFYQSPQGLLAAQFIRRQLSHLNPLFQQKTPTKPETSLLAIGYISPFIETQACAFQPLINLMPKDMQGEYQRNANKQNITCIGDEQNLPFADMSMDWVWIMHALEFSENPKTTLTEIWRVLDANGKLIIGVPARRGLWARAEHTPLGHGHPFSEKQMRQLLTSQQFTNIKCVAALYWPPQKKYFWHGFAKFAEASLPYILPHSGGMLLFRAEKSMTPSPQHKRIRKASPIFVPKLKPAMPRS